MINHIKQSQQVVNIIVNDNIFVKHLDKNISLQTICQDSYKQFTDNKQDVNQPFTKNISSAI